MFSQGYRPGSLGGRGLSPEELAAMRPGLVYVSLCAFGHAGPWASRRGFDTVVQTVSGMTTRQAEIVPGKTAGPQFYPVSAIDYCTGYLMAFGAMVALARRAREGGSWLVRISLAQVGKWIVDLGEVPAAALTDVPAEFTPAELEQLVDGERDAVRPAAPSQARRAAVGDAAALGAAVGAARLSSPGVAGARRGVKGNFRIFRNFRYRFWPSEKRWWPKHWSPAGGVQRKSSGGHDADPLVAKVGRDKPQHCSGASSPFLTRRTFCTPQRTNFFDAGEQNNTCAPAWRARESADHN